MADDSKPAERKPRLQYDNPRSPGAKKEPEKKPDPKPEAKAGDDERGAMFKRHEVERRDTHGAHRDEMRDMAKRQGGGDDPVAANRATERDHMEMRARHRRAMEEMDNRHLSEMQQMHARTEQGLMNEKGDTSGGEPASGGAMPPTPATADKQGA